MASPPPEPSLELALAVVGYQWALRADEFVAPDAIAGLEQLRAAVADFPTGQPPLGDVYPHVARLAALSLKVLASLGDPGDVDGLRGFEGFDLWRQSR
jgi:hypothetical protein